MRASIQLLVHAWTMSSATSTEPQPLQPWQFFTLAGLVGGVLGYLSWTTLTLGAFTGFVLGAVFGIALILGGRGTRKTAIPFGPFMVAGALLGIFFAGPVAGLYWDAVLGR